MCGYLQFSFWISIALAKSVYVLIHYVQPNVNHFASLINLQFTTCLMYMLSASPWGQSPSLTCKGGCKISQANLRNFSWGVQSGVTQQKTPLMPTLPVSHISTERENFLTIVWEWFQQLKLDLKIIDMMYLLGDSRKYQCMPYNESLVSILLPPPPPPPPALAFENSKMLYPHALRRPFTQ